jgi:hypothetical protein
MARSHTGNGQYTNPHVRFEHSDVNVSKLLKVVLPIVLILILATVATLWLGQWLTRSEEGRKKSTLPPAYEDTKAQQLPQPALESMEDMVHARVRLYPPRAREDLARQEKKQKKDGVVPIDEAIQQMAQALQQQSKDQKQRHAPDSFAVPLPSKASSGRAETGGD